MSDKSNHIRDGHSRQSRKAGAEHVILCPRCRKEHFSDYAVLDEFFNCECGFSFYAFEDRGLRIMMTPDEAHYEPIARAMRRFVVSTGRCQDIDQKLLEPTEQVNTVELQQRDLDEELTEILEEYQMAVFGQCYLTKELICSICESFEGGTDVELKKLKDRVDLIELKRKKVPEKDTKPRRQAAYARQPQSRNTPVPCSCSGIMMMSQATNANFGH